MLTFELSNVGTIPLKLYPGVRVAQLILHDAEPPVSKEYDANRKYYCPVGPEFSQVHLDNDGRAFSVLE